MTNKLFSIILGVILLIGISSCSQAQTSQKSNTDDSQIIERAFATIQQKGNFFFIVFDEEPKVSYIDTELDAPFREDKMRVIISGQKLPIPPNVRMIGNPFKVTMIEKNGGIQIDTSIPKSDSTFTDLGTVQMKADVFVIETTETVYVPKKLGADFQKVGKAVTFTAKKLPIPPNVRMIGQPIEIVTMKSTPIKSKQLKQNLNDRTRTKIK